jgi:GTP-binding protein EngB required for normal cell division
MTLTVRRRSGRATGIGDRLAALDEALDLARGRVDSGVVAAAERVAGKAGERLRFGDAHTVVALAGATGSGKSSLFNALVGEQLSKVGMRRPTTGVAHAAVWGPDDAGPLLDWLDVPRRHLLDAAPDGALDDGLDGLVLLDLPDVDSVEQQHRLEADRLVERVDLLVWVLDPQKYADAVLHDRYLAPLAGHGDVLLVVLNQVDRLTPAARAGCLADLARLLDTDGLAGVPVVPASATTGEGVEALRSELGRRVAAKRAAVSRLAADLDAVASELGRDCGGAAADGVGRADREALVVALADAAGAEQVVDAVARNHRLRARQATGWPFIRWVSRFRPDPARRLRLRPTPSELVRTSLPGPSAVQRARVDSALRQLGDNASAGLPEPWPDVVRAAATRRRPELPDLLDRAVAGTELEVGRRPRWWSLAGVLQLLLAAVTILGVVWLAALFAVGWLQLPPPPTPHLGVVPLPTLLLAAGVVLGLLVALFAGWAARAGAARSAVRVRRRLEERVRAVAADAVVTPVERELAAHTELCAAVVRLRGR